MARGAAVTRTAVQTVKPITDSSVRETMDLTSSHIDDTNAGWSGRSEKNLQLIRRLIWQGGKIFVVADWRPVRRFGRCRQLKFLRIFLKLLDLRGRIRQMSLLRSVARCLVRVQPSFELF